jgi:Uma2 family endonuclease
LIETDWHVSNDTIVRPDLVVVCQAVYEKVVVTPELIVEVVLESSTKRDEVMKFDLYQQEGVLYYILVYPENRLVKVYLNQALGFKKLGDHCNNDAKFDIGDCSFTIDFSSVWR